MITDPIADLLTRIRNAIKARHLVLQIPASKIKKSILEVLEEKGYIKGFQLQKDDSPQGILRINLKYHPQTKAPAIVKLLRISKPGLRKYSQSKDLPHVLNGLGIAILSTSQGVMSDKEARKKNIGGEILCNIH